MIQTVRNLLLCVISIAVVQIASLANEAEAQTLRYNWKSGQQFSYRFDIVVDGDDETTSYKGITHYTVNNASPEQARVTYQGGLTESKKTKRVNRGPRGFGPPFGPSFGGPRGFPSPFSKPTFAGKTRTTNRITISPAGEVLAMEGDSQLPYLLGNVSLLPFEALPESNQRNWSVGSGISITEEKEDSRHRFGRFDPFGGQDKKSVQAAKETTRYATQSTNGQLVSIGKSYQLSMPQTADNAAFEMTGTGTWTFDLSESIPHSLDMKYKLNVKKGNSTTTIPITVKYSRISAAEVAKMAADAKKLADERAQAAATAKAKAEAPLTETEKSSALAVLASNDTARMAKTLTELSSKTPKNPDPDIAAAIESLLGNGNKTVASAASKALTNWSPSYKLKKSLAKAYQGPGPVKSTGRVVESITPLYVGQLVQAQRRNRGSFWFAAKVEELQPDGNVKLGFLTWGKVRDSETVARRSIQLAPEELAQPAKPASARSVANSNTSRTWTDATGRFKIEAVFVGITDGKVNLRRADSRVIAVPLAKLSAADQSFVQKIQNAENPFLID